MRVIVRRLPQGWVIVVSSSMGNVAGKTVYAVKDEAVAEARRQHPNADVEIEE